MIALYIKVNRYSNLELNWYIEKNQISFQLSWSWGLSLTSGLFSFGMIAASIFGFMKARNYSYQNQNHRNHSNHQRRHYEYRNEYDYERRHERY